MSTSELPLVAFDTGIFHGGLIRNLGLDRSLCPVLIELAARRRIRLLVLNSVFEEMSNWATLNGVTEWLDETLINYFDQCVTEWPPPLRELEIERFHEQFHRLLRHAADARVAVEVHILKPDYFIHTNPEHWGRVPDGAFGSTKIMGPRAFLREIGITQIPKPRRTKPSGR